MSQRLRGLIDANSLPAFNNAKVRIFDPSDLLRPAQVPHDDQAAVHEPRGHSMQSEGQVWCSPERHGQITGVMKTQIDPCPWKAKACVSFRADPCHDAGL